MRRAVCTKCKVSFKPETNGVAVAETFQGDQKIYKIWNADLLKCPGCGVKIILGFPDRPLAEHFAANFDEVLAYFREKLKKGEAYVWNEKIRLPGERMPEF